MDLPKRTKQQRSEAHSYAILLYKLRDLGIFRNLTENDYGIDFELELIQKEQVTARVAKIQVKSAEDLNDYRLAPVGSSRLNRPGFTGE